MMNFPSPLAKTPCSQCKGPGFHPWPGNHIPQAVTKTQHSQIKKEKKRENFKKIAMRYDNTPIKIAKVQKQTSPNAGEDVEQQKFSSIAGGNAKWHSHFGRQFSIFLQS